MKATNLITMIALIPLCLSCTQRSYLAEDDIQVLNQQTVGSNLWYDEAYELVNGINIGSLIRTYYVQFMSFIILL